MHVTDVSNASRTMLFNIHTMRVGRRAAAVARTFRVVAAGGARVERSLWRSDDALGLRDDADRRHRGRSAGGAFRTEVHVAGHGEEHIRDRMLSAAEHRARRRFHRTQSSGDDGGVEDRRRVEYALEGSVFIGGAVVQWLRDGIAPDSRFQRSGGAALIGFRQRRRVHGARVRGLGAPHWDQYARGAIFGITRATTSGHLARAALESIAFQVADVLDAMQLDAGTPLPELHVDGGAAANETLLRFQADILGIPVVRPAVMETTALGAAYMAGIATGFWRDAGEIASMPLEEKRYEPRMSQSQTDALRGRWKEALSRSKRWA